ncbi:MAG: HTTM domain-containing protein [Bacteroidota bacterium]
MLSKHLYTWVDPLGLAIFRIAFGICMFIGQVRFLAMGWVADLYLTPNLHFPYQGFEWVQVLPEPLMYGLLILSALSALAIGLGLFYRFSTIIFLLSFTYLELIDKVWYLNHYYFVSLIAFLLIFVPANTVYSLDAYRKKESKYWIPAWTVRLIQLQIGIVYFFAGLAKLKTSWLLSAEPMHIWLSARTDFPLVGAYFDERWVAYIFSWAGMIFDLSIFFFLLLRRTRPYAYLAVLFFHLTTAMLFPIGMFPWLMMASTLIFFDAQDWQKLFQRGRYIFPQSPPPAIGLFKQTILIGFIVFQLCWPLRHFFHSGDVLWNEKGFRFAWHVMVMEKNGMTYFHIKDRESTKTWTIHPREYLIPAQESQMSFKPDLIEFFALHLRSRWLEKGYPNIEIEVENRVCVNRECKDLLWLLPSDADKIIPL